jgi:hypothetical protein
MNDTDARAPGELELPALRVPEHEAVGVEAPRLPIACVKANLHHHLVGGDDLPAGVACRTVARTSSHSRGAFARQATVLELLPDEEAKRFRLHGWPKVRPMNTLDSPGPTPGAPTHVVKGRAAGR